MTSLQFFILFCFLSLLSSWQRPSVMPPSSRRFLLSLLCCPSCLSPCLVSADLQLWRMNLTDASRGPTRPPPQNLFMKQVQDPARLLINPFTACTVAAEFLVISVLPFPFSTWKTAASLALSRKLKFLSLYLHLCRSSSHFPLHISHLISFTTISSLSIFLHGPSTTCTMTMPYLLDVISKLFMRIKRRQCAVLSPPACDVKWFCRGYCSDYGSVMISKQR